MVAFGEKVRVHYVGRLDDGTEFNNSYKAGKPLEFTVGAGQTIVGFDRAVFMMGLGEKRTVRLEPCDAYGEYREDLVEQIPCHLMPNWEQMPVGQRISLRMSNGQAIQVVCKKVEDGFIYLDHNHPLAGQALTFEIELAEIVHDSAIERELHSEGCACGCHKFKDAILRQNAEASSRTAEESLDGHAHAGHHGDDCGCGQH